MSTLMTDARLFTPQAGQLTQIRVFEKRYQLLMKALVEGGGGCFGFPIDRETGITAVVRRCGDVWR
jgi:hypothetical protein